MKRSAERSRPWPAWVAVGAKPAAAQQRTVARGASSSSSAGGEERMWKKNNKWYTYEECLGHHNHNKAEAGKAWNEEHWTRTEVNSYESRQAERKECKQVQQQAKVDKWERKQQAKWGNWGYREKEESSSDGKQEVDYGDEHYRDEVSAMK